MTQQKPPIKLKGWRFAAFFGALIGTIGAACYPIIIEPQRNAEHYRKIAEENRKFYGKSQDDLQPNHMKVWTDRFERPGKPGYK